LRKMAGFFAGMGSLRGESCSRIEGGWCFGFLGRGVFAMVGTAVNRREVLTTVASVALSRTLDLRVPQGPSEELSPPLQAAIDTLFGTDTEPGLVIQIWRGGSSIVTDDPTEHAKKLLYFYRGRLILAHQAHRVSKQIFEDPDVARAFRAQNPTSSEGANNQTWINWVKAFIRKRDGWEHRFMTGISRDPDVPWPPDFRDFIGFEHLVELERARFRWEINCLPISPSARNKLEADFNEVAEKLRIGNDGRFDEEPGLSPSQRAELRLALLKALYSHPEALAIKHFDIATPLTPPPKPKLPEMWALPHPDSETAT
jgi:hypothetical protein